MGLLASVGVSLALLSLLCTCLMMLNGLKISEKLLIKALIGNRNTHFYVQDFLKY